MFSRIVLFIKTFVLVLLMAGGVYASNFADTYGFSASGISMGNAMTAVVNDWSSVYYNIAGLGKTGHLRNGGFDAVDGGSGDMTLKMRRTTDPAQQKKSTEKPHLSQLSMSFLYTIPQFNINIPQRIDPSDGAAVSTNGDKDLHFGVMVIGLAVDMNVLCELPSFISSGRIGLGLSANADGSLVKVNDIDPRTHNFLRYGREAQKAVIIAGFGLGFLNDMFGVGAGANVSFGGTGVVNLDDMAVVTNLQYPDAQAKMDLSASPTVVAGLYFSPGKLTSILEGLDVGASYRMESYMEIYPFDTAAIIPSGSTDVRMAMLVSIFDYYQPHIITFGVAYDLGAILPVDLTVSMEAEYQMWSRFKVSQTAEKYFTEVYANASSDYFPDLKDRIVPKIGFEYQLLDWLAIRAGYYLQFSFIPDGEMEKEVNYLDNDKHVGSLGAKFDFPKLGPLAGPLEITIAYQFQYLVQRSVDKTGTYETTLNPDYSYDGMCHTAILGVSMKI